MMKNLSVDGDRLWANILELGSIGKDQSGVSRVSFNDYDMQARHWLLSRMRFAGLDSHIDEVGNVFGTVPSSCSKNILVGSHTDTVPNGGVFDGALGVLAALECAQTIAENNIEIKAGIRIASFSNEEGTQAGGGLFGSRYFAEGIEENEQRLVEPVLKRAGLAGFTSQRVLESLSDYLCYLELHVEQGGVLADSKEQIGVVQGIVCIHNLDVTFRGVPNHAGTTPMKGRKDALVGASELVVKVAEAVSKAGGGATTGTCGQLEVSPGARNVIPGEVKLAIEVRDLLPQVADRVLSVLMSEARLISERYCLEVDFERVSRTPPAGMDDKIQKTIFGQAKSLGLKTRYMPSGASHDAAVFAKYVPTGMIFVPSRDGISHSPDEWTDKQDCINGANVLLKTLLYIAEQGEGFFF